MDNSVRHNCGLAVAYSLHDVYKLIRSLQHRGREATGIAAVGYDRIDVIKWAGPVNTFEIDDLHKIFPGTQYHTFLGHVRYATMGREDKILEDAHPHVIGGKQIHRGNHILIEDCDMAIVHNGQVNQEFLDSINSTVLTGCDSESILVFYKENGERALMRKIPKSYTLAIADRSKQGIIVMRDRTGIKPGVLGWKDGKYGVASEDIAFRKNGGEFIEDLEPGSIYYLYPNGSYKKENVVSPKIAYCFFEWNYIADAHSIINNLSVRLVREELGRELAKEFKPDDIDIVTYLPRCPESAARTFAKQSNRSLSLVFYKMRGERAFQGSTEEDRINSIKSNLHLLTNIIDQLKDKIILCIDDSIVRGNNSKRERNLLYGEAKVKKVYHLNYTPPIGIIGSDNEPRGCIDGVDMPPDDNFIARNRTSEEINKLMGMTVGYLSVEGMLQVFERLGIKRNSLCYYCIGGPKIDF